MCMHACMHVCMYACMYVCMHVCMYVFSGLSFRHNFLRLYSECRTIALVTVEGPIVPLPGRLACWCTSQCSHLQSELRHVQSGTQMLHIAVWYILWSSRGSHTCFITLGLCIYLQRVYTAKPIFYDFGSLYMPCGYMEPLRKYV